MKDNFRYIWQKLANDDNLEDVKEIYHTYRPPQETYSNFSTLKHTFSQEATLHSESTFSEGETLAPETFSQEETQASTSTFSENATIASQKSLNVDEPSANKNKEYDDLEKINQGGMGVIFKACQTILNRDVAIKKVLGKAQQEKFMAEALVTAYLEHPNIVSVYDLDYDEQGEMFIAMKLVEGVSWRELLYKENQKAFCYKHIERHLQILIDLCNAVAYAHSKNIVHCDLKPENVMIGDFGEVLLMDWGIAVNISESKTAWALHKSHVKSPMGTPCYIPPELAEGQGDKICPATDIYLLGGILYEILHQRPPHMEKSTWLTLLAAKQGKMATFNEDLPQELKNICMKALCKNPEDRYQNVQEFQQNLQSFLVHHESILQTESAINILQQCYFRIESDTEMGGLDENLVQRSYQKIPQAIEKLQSALDMWPENSRAYIEMQNSYSRYATVALYNNDLHLAADQLAKLDSETSNYDELREKLRNIQKVKKTIRRITIMFIILAMTNTIPMLLLLVSILVPYTLANMHKYRPLNRKILNTSIFFTLLIGIPFLYAELYMPRSIHLYRFFGIISNCVFIVFIIVYPMFLYFVNRKQKSFRRDVEYVFSHCLPNFLYSFLFLFYYFIIALMHG
ncbi:protein kinase domain-containing protein [Candidatus Uabimicrobium amorphum]|uniref:Serine/threonine protein kinase n=1 Tax=Uabimicrobium amorphum TaxID=2596890 RepID=A0A5S9IS28_UABAM|nr:protein kinase [Candidatus Uabimicrobium amorphum]BBM86130.1 serine/threonine protein kinase [Candidatus Uabimicrobium amorphum]